MDLITLEYIIVSPKQSHLKLRYITENELAKAVGILFLFLIPLRSADVILTLFMKCDFSEQSCKWYGIELILCSITDLLINFPIVSKVLPTMWVVQTLLWSVWQNYFIMWLIMIEKICRPHKNYKYFDRSHSLLFFRLMRFLFIL